MAIEQRDLHQQLLRNSGKLRNEFRRVLADGFFEGGDSGCVASDIFSVDKIPREQNVQDSVEECDVRPRLEGQIDVGHHRRFCDPWVCDDQNRRFVCFQSLAQNRMIVGNVRAEQENQVGFFQILVRAGRTVAAE